MEIETRENVRQAVNATIGRYVALVQVSVIIVSYNVRVFLEHAIVSLQKSLAGFDAEIVVVDNASDDGSVEMVRQKFPGVRLLVNKNNDGFARANNQALEHSNGEFILLLNPDTIVQEDTVGTMVDFMKEHPDVGLAGCKILDPDGTLQPACRRSFPTPWVAFTKLAGLSSLFPHSKLFGKYNLTYLDPNASHEVDAVSGSFMFVRKKAIDDVGGLDEQFFMYGEDLDWCYRIKQAGWRVMYTPSTQIIHYKGESTRRSDLDDVKLFYEAMRVFARKHFRGGLATRMMVESGILLREWVAFLVRIARPLRTVVLDIILCNLILLLSEYFWFGQFFRFPAYAYPITLTVPALVLVSVFYSFGLYTTRKLSASNALSGVVVTYIILSALTFFFKQYGFSRMVVAISGAVNLLVLPGWRLGARALLRSPEHRKKSLFGKRTLIVGSGQSSQEVLRKIRARVDDGYEVVGFIDQTHLRVGEKILGVEILGSIDNIGKVIREQKASEVIFSTDTISYMDILSIIARTRSRGVNYRLVPSNLEVIIGKTHIDELDDIPLIDIDYNIHRVFNRAVKRLFDLTASMIMLVSLFPVVAAFRRGKGGSRFARKVLELPRVFRGELSFVGVPEYIACEHVQRGTSPDFVGKPGLTGLIQINFREDLQPDEIDRYNLYYAKNQSFMLDMEILLKSILLLFHVK